MEAWDLPSRPTKATDSRAYRFGSARSVELDAIDANQLRDMTEKAILRHVDPAELRTLQVAEASEREWLQTWATEVRA